MEMEWWSCFFRFVISAFARESDFFSCLILFLRWCLEEARWREDEDGDGVVEGWSGRMKI